MRWFGTRNPAAGVLSLLAACAATGPEREATQTRIAPGFELQLRAPALAVAFGPDGTWLAATTQDEGVSIWDLASGERRRVLGDEAAVPLALAASGDLLVAACGDGTVKVWNVVTGTLVRTLRGREREVESLALSSDGRWIASGSYDGVVLVHGLADGRVRTRIEMDWANTYVGWGPENRSVVVAHGIDLIRVYGLDGALLRTLPQSRDGGYGTLAARGPWCVAPDYPGALNLFDLASGALRRRWIAHFEEIHAVAIDPARRRIVSGCWESKVRLWNLSDGRLLWSLYLTPGESFHDEEITDVAFSPDGRYVAAATRWGRIVLIHAKTGRRLGESKSPGAR